MIKLRRFFYHYHRYGERKMTIHFKNRCMQVDNIECNVPCETKFSKRQPTLVMRGFCIKVKIMSLNGEKIGIIQ